MPPQEVPHGQTQTVNVQRLFYPTILHEIDEINRVSEIGLSCVQEEEQREQ